MVKKVLFLMTMSLGMMFPSMAQNIPSYVPTNGLVGWWPFNGNANDESGNGNYGTVNGATLTTDRNGKSNSAYRFDGINDYLIGNSSQLPTSERTISLWLNSSFTKEKTFFIGYGGGNCGTSFGIYANTSACGVQGENAFSYSSHCCNNNFNEPYQQSVINNWNYLVFVTKKDSTFLYLNGKVITSRKLAINITNTQSKNFIFGGLVNTNGLDIFPETFYQGNLDDIAIYNRALTQQEITSLYNSCSNPNATIISQGNTTFCQGGFVNLNASTGANYTYQWYNNGQIINGATASTYQANTSGSYSVKVMDGTCNTTSSATLVTVNPNPTASITPQGNTTFCQGGFVNLVANGGTSYQWNTGSSNSTISANQSGTYTVNVFNSFGCQASASQVVTVNANPTVTLNGLNEYTLKNQPFVQLTGTPAGGTFIGEGVQGSTFTLANVALGKKTITYNYTSTQGCSGSSTRSTFVVDSIGNVCSVTKYDTILKLKFKLTTGINANQMTSMTLYPNPTTDVLNIEIGDAKVLDGYRYRILDAVGKEVYNQLVKNPITEIPLKSLGAAGMYLFEVIDQQNKTIQSNKIVME
jgi:hypothetical protein